MISFKKPAKKILASLLALIMAVPGLGVFTVLADGAPHNHFGAVRSERADTDNIEIAAVRVVDGGFIQYRYRDTVYAGTGMNFYTTLRDASVTDSRLFIFETQLTAAQVGDSATFLNRVSYTFGGIAPENWLGRPPYSVNDIGAVFDNPDNRFIIVPGDGISLPAGVPTPSHRLEAVPGGYVLVTEILFRTPFDRLTPTLPEDELQVGVPGQQRMNVAYTGHAAWNQHRSSARFITHEILGAWDLSVLVSGSEVARTPIRINFYDDFHTWNQIDQWARDLRNEAGLDRQINGRFVSVQPIGYTWEGRPMWNVVVAADYEAVNQYLMETRPMITANPAALQAQIRAGNAAGHRQVIYFGNNHPDETTGVDAQIVMIEQLLRQDQVSFTTVISDLFDRAAIPNVNGDDNSPSRVAGWQRAEAYLVYDENPADFEIATVAMSVDEILDDLILVFTLTTNPDGRHVMQRANSWIFDINRDNAFQTTIENYYLHQNIAVWGPTVMPEFHGHHQALLIEPCTGPHNPNFERDLMIYAMLRQSHAMGRAAISGAYNHFQIAAQNRNQDWDDGGLNYTPVFLMAFGILGYTLEIPHVNQDSNDGNVNMGFAIIHDTLHHFDELLITRLEIMNRGMMNYDNRAADIYHTWRSEFTEENAPEGFVANEIIGAVFPNVSTVNPETFTVNPFTAESDRVVRSHPDYDMLVGRPRRGHDSFFPDYFVLPVGAYQSNLQAVYDMLDKLARHDVRIHRLTTDVSYNNYFFPAGSYVINMRQALRGYVNAMLNPISDPMGYTSFYAEGIAAFPTQRNFVAVDVRQTGLLTNSLEVVFGGISPAQLRSRAFAAPETPLFQRPDVEVANSTYVIVKHNSDDAIRLVNRLLTAGSDVWMMTNYYRQGRVGDFVVRSADITPQILSQKSPQAVLPGAFFSVYGQSPDRTATINPNLWIETFELPAGLPSDIRVLAKPTVALIGGTGVNFGPDSYARFMVQFLEFNHQFVTPDQFAARASDFDAAINLNQNITEGNFEALRNAVRGGVAYIGVSVNGMTVGRNILIDAADAEADETAFPIATVADEAVFRATFETSNSIANRYHLSDTVYMIISSFFEQDVFPEAVVLTTIETGVERYHYLGGFMTPERREALRGNVVAVAANYYDTPVVLFGNYIFNRAHNRQQNVMLANAIFKSTSGQPVLYW